MNCSPTVVTGKRVVATALIALSMSTALHMTFSVPFSLPLTFLPYGAMLIGRASFLRSTLTCCLCRLAPCYWVSAVSALVATLFGKTASVFSPSPPRAHSLSVCVSLNSHSKSCVKNRRELSFHLLYNEFLSAHLFTFVSAKQHSSCTPELFVRSECISFDYYFLNVSSLSFNYFIFV